MSVQLLMTWYEKKINSDLGDRFVSLQMLYFFPCSLLYIHFQFHKDGNTADV